VAHHTGRQRDEMRAILPADLFRLDQTQIGFMDERGRLEAVTGLLVPQMASRDLMKLTVDKRHQLLQGGFVALSPLAQQRSDLCRHDPAF
jgi:hypothetical protein